MPSWYKPRSTNRQRLEQVRTINCSRLLAAKKKRIDNDDDHDDSDGDGSDDDGNDTDDHDNDDSDDDADDDYIDDDDK